MSPRAKHYVWELRLRASPEALWPLVSNTDRFNRDCGLPPFEVVAPAPGVPPPELGVRRVRATYLGIAGEWEERAFEWVEPVRFSVSRLFVRGPLRELVQSCELSAQPDGGTLLRYRISVEPVGLLGAIVIPFAVGLRMRSSVRRLMGLYDGLALEGVTLAEGRPGPAEIWASRRKLSAPGARLLREGERSPALVARLCDHVATADDLSAARMRPYALADEWGADRRETLDLFLNATREGVLDLRWEVLCPHCRGPRQGGESLKSVRSQARCDSCGVDFDVNFERSVELTFSPNPLVRRVTRREHCVGGPQVTPHILAQERLGPGGVLRFIPGNREGGYRVRVVGEALQHPFRVERTGSRQASILVGVGDRGPLEPSVTPGGELCVSNAGEGRPLVVVERVEWTDQAVSAAAVTSLQVFRDLFAREVLRPGERISVGSITLVFTDLKGSTAMYREVGDAPAFGRVLGHFEILKSAIAQGGGAVVKTMGDAVMAVFIHPAAALRAMSRAQALLARPGGETVPLALKCSLHRGPCLAISQDDRLDYFGTTVNVASRLCSQSTGSDIITTDAVLGDSEVKALLLSQAGACSRRDSAILRGLGPEEVAFWRVSNLVF